MTRVRLTMTLVALLLALGAWGLFWEKSGPESGDEADGSPRSSPAVGAHDAALEAPQLGGHARALAEEPVADDAGQPERSIRIDLDVSLVGGLLAYGDITRGKSRVPKPPPPTSSTSPAKEAGVSPLEGRRADAIFWLREEAQLLASARLDKDGKASIHVPLRLAYTARERREGRLELVFPDEDLRLAALARSYVTTDRRSAYVRLREALAAGDEPLERSLAVRRGPFVTGRFVRRGGEVVPRAHLAIDSDDGGLAPDVCADEEGRFAFPVFASGTFSLRGDGQRALERLVLAAGKPRDLGDVLLEEDGAYRGIVTYAGGTPVSDFRVELRRVIEGRHRPHPFAPSLSCETAYPAVPSTRSRRDGTFALYEPGTSDWGRWRLDGSGPCLSASVRSTQQVDPGTDEARTQVVVRAHGIEIDVFWPNGEPAYGIGVTATQQASGKEDPPRLWAGTHASRRCMLWLPHGTTWEIGIAVEGFAEIRREVIVPEAGNESRERFELRLEDPAPGQRPSVR